MPPSRESIPLAVGLGALSALSFAAMSAMLRGARLEGATWGQLVFYRSAVTALAAAAATAILGLSLRGLPWRVLGLRTLLGGSAMALGFYALSRPELPIGDAEILRRTSPVFVVLLAWPVLGERPKLRTVALVLLAFGGTALVLGPSLQITWKAGGAGLMAGALGSGAYLAIRHLVRDTPATVVILVFTSAMSIVSAPFALAAPFPEGQALGLLLGAGLAGTLGQVFMTHAYRFAPAGIVSTTGYLAVAFATAFGAIAFHHAPAATSIGGSLVIVLSCVLIARQRKEPSAGRGGLDAIPPRK
jgi:drug/metabolite transporter (DMT)-like permease